MTEVGRITAEIRADTSRLDSDINGAKSKLYNVASDVEGRFAKVGSAIGSALKTGIMAAGAAAAGASTAGVKMFMDLESAASAAASKSIDVYGKSAEEITKQYDDMLNHVINVSNKLGASTVFSPVEVAKTYDVLAAAGMNVSKIGENELLPFLNMASASGEDLAGSTETLLGYINAFGLDVKDSAKVADQLSMAMNGSRLSLSMLNYALTQGGSAAHQSGMSIAEFTGITGVLADKMYTGEQAGAALKTAILALYTPADKQMEALTKLGISYDQVDPRTHNFIDTLELLISKGADIGDFANIFTDSSGSIMYAAAGSIDRIRELTNTISGSEGTTQAIADLKMSSDKLPGAWELAKGAAEGLLTSLGQKLEPAVVKLLNAFDAASPSIQNFIDALFAGDWGSIANMITSLAGTIKDKLVSAAKYAVTAITNIDWGGAARTIGNFLANGIQAGISALKDLGKTVANWFEQSGGWSGLGNKVAGMFKSGWTTIQNFGKTVSGWFESLGGWEGLGQRTANIFSSAWNGLKSLGSTIAGYVSSVDWGGIGQSAVNLFQSAWSAISSLATQIYGYLAGVDWGGLGQKAANAFHTAWNVLKSIGTEISGYLSNVNWGSIGDKAAGAFHRAWDVLKSIGTTISGYITSVNWNDVGTKVGNAISSGISDVKTFAGGIYDNIKSWVDTGGAKSAGEYVGNALANAIKALMNVGQWIADKLKERGQGDLIAGAVKTALDWIQLGKDIAVDFLSGLVTGLSPLANELRNMILEGISNGLRGISDAIPEWANIGGIKEKISGWADVVKGAEIPTVWSRSTGGGYERPTTSTYTSYGGYYSTTAAIKPQGYVRGLSDEQLKKLASDPETRFVIERIDDKAYRIVDTLTKREIGTYTGNFASEALQRAVEGLEFEVGRTKAAAQAEESARVSRMIQAQSLANTVSTMLTSTIAYGGGVLSEAAANFKGITDKEKEYLSSIIPELKYSSMAFFNSTNMFTAAATQGAATELSAEQQGAAIETEAANQARTIIINGSQTAANVLNNASKVAANFTTQAGQAVRIGLTQSGQEIAVIGRVAQQNFTNAGGQWVAQTVAGASQAAATTATAASQAGTTTTSAANQAANIGISGSNNAASNTIAASRTAGNIQTESSTVAGNRIVSSGESFAQKVESASGSIVKSFSSMLEAGWKTMVSNSSTKTGSSAYGASAGNVQTTFNDCMFENFTDTCTGIAVNALKYTDPSGGVHYINPMTYQQTGGVSSRGSSSVGGNYLTSQGYQLPAIFLARGAIVDEPTLAVVGERGEEMVLPTEITRAIMGMVGVGGRQESIVINPADIYLDGRKVGRVIFEVGKKSMGMQGFSIR